MRSLEDRIGAQLTPRGEAVLRTPRAIAEWSRDHKKQIISAGVIGGLALGVGLQMDSNAHYRDELSKKLAIEVALSSPQLELDKQGNVVVNDGSEEVTIPVRTVKIPAGSTLSQELVAAGIQAGALPLAETEAGGQLGNGPGNAAAEAVVRIPVDMFEAQSPAN